MIDLFKQRKEETASPLKIDRMELIAMQIQAMLQSELGASVRWSYDSDEQNPFLFIARDLPLQIRANGNAYEAEYRFGTVVKLNRKITKFKEDCESTSFSFAQNYLNAHYGEILKQAEAAKKKGFESFAIQTGDLDDKALEVLCELLIKRCGFIGAKIRRKKILVALNARALTEKVPSERDKERARNGKAVKTYQKKPGKVLKGIACNYLSEAHLILAYLAESARAKGKTEYSFVPDIESDAIPFLVKELKANGHDARLKGKKLYVTLEDTKDQADDFLGIEPDRT